MVHIERGPAPSIVRPDVLKAAYERLASGGREAFQSGLLQRYKPALKELFRGKCAYCESSIDVISHGDVENFRPKAGALNLDGTFSPDHYWWLTYEWTNLYLACQICNQVHKGNRFPVAAARAAVHASGEALAAEQPLLLDPCHDREAIDEHLTFTDEGLVVSETERGRVTIDVLGLNREPLVLQRRERVEHLRLITQTITSLARFDLWLTRLTVALQPRQPYLGLARQFVRRWQRKLIHDGHPGTKAINLRLANVSALALITPALSEAAVRATRENYERLERQDEMFSLRGVWKRGGRIDRTALNRYFRKRRLVRRVEIRNFRGMARLAFDFPEASSGSSWMMLLGENGTGKTSILRAIALTLMGDAERLRLGVTPDDLLAGEVESGHVHVYLTNVADPERLEFVRGSKACGGTATEPKVLLLGYGATRLLPRGAVREPRAGPARADNLLQRTFFLRDAASWLASLDAGAFARVRQPLEDLLLLSPSQHIVRDDEGAVRVQFGHKSPLLAQLSDGFQSMVALATDVLSVLDPVWRGAIRQAEGLVLIDELDAHLHPRWRMEVVERLRRCFPRVQFIASTHDPLCLRGLREGEVTLLRKTRSGRVFAMEDVPSPEGMSADQLLTSEHFGLSSTIDPRVERLFREYYRLLRIKARTDKQNGRLVAIKGELDRLHHMGATVRERLMLEAIDRYLAAPPPAGRRGRSSLRGELDAELAAISSTGRRRGTRR